MPHFFGRWSRRILLHSKQLVMRGDDVFDLRAVFRLLNAQGVQQDAVIGERFAQPF